MGKLLRSSWYLIVDY